MGSGNTALESLPLLQQDPAPAQTPTKHDSTETSTETSIDNEQRQQPAKGQTAKAEHAAAVGVHADNSTIHQTSSQGIV